MGISHNTRIEFSGFTKFLTILWSFVALVFLGTRSAPNKKYRNDVPDSSGLMTLLFTGVPNKAINILLQTLILSFLLWLSNSWGQGFSGYCNARCATFTFTPKYFHVRKDICFAVNVQRKWKCVISVGVVWRPSGIQPWRGYTTKPDVIAQAKSKGR